MLRGGRERRSRVKGRGGGIQRCHSCAALVQGSEDVLPRCRQALHKGQVHACTTPPGIKAPCTSGCSILCECAPGRSMCRRARRHTARRHVWTVGFTATVQRAPESKRIYRSIYRASSMVSRIAGLQASYLQATAPVRQGTYAVPARSSSA